MTNLVYFSSVSGNTKRFIEKLGLPGGADPAACARRRAARRRALRAGRPRPTAAATADGAVPKQVITFLNDAQNRALIRGVIAAGNTNFGERLLPRRRHHRREVPGAAPVSLRSIRNP